MTEYERYLQKVKKISEKVHTIKQIVIAVSICLAVLLAGAVVCTLRVGSFVHQLSCKDVVYGETASPSAKAFLSSVSYMYSEKGTDNWTDKVPINAGEYTVKAISLTAFKKEKTSFADFTIHKRELQISVKETDVEFGESPFSPVVSGDLAYSDKISAEFSPDWKIARHGDTLLHLNTDGIRIVNSENIDVTKNYVIASAVDAPVCVQKRKITISMKSETVEYDGKPHGCAEWKVVTGSLGMGHILTAVSNEEYTEVGSFPLGVAGFTLTDGSGTDLSSEYEVTVVPATLEIVARKISIKIADAEKVYDGTPLKSERYSFSSGSLIPGDILSAIFSGSITEAGTAQSNITSWTVKRSGVDVSKNYEILLEAGNLTVTKRKVSVKTGSRTAVYSGNALSEPSYTILSGSIVSNEKVVVSASASITDVGTKKNDLTISVSSAAGKDVTGSYEFSYETGTLAVTPLKITVDVALDSDMFYNGVKHTKTKTKVSGTMPQGHELRVTVLTEIIKPGEYNPEYEVKVVDGASDDVTDNYVIDLRSNKVTIQKKSVTLRSESGKTEFMRGIEYEYPVLAENESKNFLDSYSFSIQTSGWTKLEKIGSAENKFSAAIIKNGEDVSDFFSIKYEYGQITVTKRVVKVVSLDASKVYDGKPLTQHEFDVIVGSIMPEDELKAEFTGSQTEIGKSDNTFKYRIIESSTGEDVTDKYYETDKEFGNLVVSSAVDPSDPGSDPQGPGGGSGDPGSDPQEPGGGSDQPMASDQTTMSNSSFENGGDPVYKIKSDIAGFYYIKQMSYGDYNGINRWRAAPKYPMNVSDFSPMKYTALCAVNAGFTPHTVKIASISGKEFDSDFLPYYTVDHEGTDNADVSVKLSGKNVYEYQTLCVSTENVLGISSTLNNVRYEKLSLGEGEYRNFVYDNYLNVPDSTKSILLKLAEEAGIKASDPDVITKVQRYIQGAATYNLKFAEIPEGKDMVVYFLTESKEGICQHYAAAATMMYRSLGIPARYTTGYVADAVPNEWTDIDPKSAHAWTEVYINRVGWVIVEVTGSSGNGPAGGPSGEMDSTNFNSDPNSIQNIADSIVRDQSPVNIDGPVLSSDELGSEFEFNAEDYGLVEGDRLLVKYGEPEEWFAGMNPDAAPVESYRIINSKGEDVTDQYNNITIMPASVEMPTINVSLPDLIDITSGLETNVLDSIMASLSPFADKDLLSERIRFESYDSMLHIDGSTIWTSEPGMYTIRMIGQDVDLNNDGVPEYSISDQYVQNNVYSTSLSNTEVMNVSPEEAISRGILDMSYENEYQIYTGQNGREYNVLFIKVNPFTAEYDGSYVESSDFTIITGKLFFGDVLTLHGTCSARFVGTYDNSVDMLKVTDSEGNDVTSKYIIKVFPGTVEVTSSIRMKNTELKIGLWKTLMVENYLNDIWNGQYVWDVLFDGDDGKLYEKDGVIYVKNTGRFLMNASSNIDLNDDGTPEYVLRTDIDMLVRIPVVIIVLAVAVFAAIVLGLLMRRKRRV